MKKGTEGATTFENVKINQIVREASFQVRNRIDPATVKRYADLMKAGTTLAPIKLARVDGMLLLVDGWHRLQAHESLGRGWTHAEIVESNRQNAQWLAASANLAHGLQLKPSEYRNVFCAYMTTRQHVYGRGRMQSYREIGVALGRPHTTIRNWMLKDFPEIASKMGSDEQPETGGLRTEITPEVPKAEEYLSLLIQLFQSSADPEFRGSVIGLARETLADMEASGGWNEPPPVPF